MLGASALLALTLSACGNGEEATKEVKVEAESPSIETKQKNEVQAEQTITYLDQEYSLPAEINSIVAASLESMEDAAILGVKPVGVLAIANAIPSYLVDELEGASLVGDKFAPNNEAILGLNPDVILGSSKHGEEVVTALNKIQTMIPYSHISTNWKENLLLLGQLSGKEVEANTIISEYEEKSAEAKDQLKELKDKKVLVLRIRQGSINVYPENIYLNPVLYEDLGLAVPEAVAKAEAQSELALEGLAEINPDYIFLQFETTENKDNPAALEELLENPIFKSTEAVKNDHVFVNAVDPLAQGGTAWSKVKFLEAAITNLTK